MTFLFLEYPKCSTCQKAKAWLEEHHIDFASRHIVENNPAAHELKEWYERSGLPLKRFVNTSGLLYKSMNLQVNAGIQNIFNAYQNDFDKGADRDSGYIYGPSLPRSFFAGVKISY